MSRAKRATRRISISRGVPTKETADQLYFEMEATGMFKLADIVDRGTTGTRGPKSNTSIAGLFYASAMAAHLRFAPRIVEFANILSADCCPTQLHPNGRRHVSEFSVSRRLSSLTKLSMAGITERLDPTETPALEDALPRSATIDAAYDEVGEAKRPRVEHLSRILNHLSQELIARSLPDWISGEDAPAVTLSVDGTLLNASCRQRSKAEIAAGVAASDPNATFRVKSKGRGSTGKPDSSEVTFGYNLVALTARVIEGEHLGTELVVATALITAAEDERSPVLALLDQASTLGLNCTGVLADRGFNSEDLFSAIRSRGYDPIFQPKRPHHGQVEQLPNGYYLLDGGLFSHDTPAHLLWRFDKNGERTNWVQPVITAPSEEFRHRNHELQRYRLPLNRIPSPGDSSHEYRTHSSTGHLVCPDRTTALINEDNQRRRRKRHCDGNHPAETADGKKSHCHATSITITAKQCPQTFQRHHPSSPEHSQIYANRSSVERSYSSLKSPHQKAFTKGRFLLRDIDKLGFLAAIVMAVTTMQSARGLYDPIDPETPIEA